MSNAVKNKNKGRRSDPGNFFHSRWISYNLKYYPRNNVIGSRAKYYKEVNKKNKTIFRPTKTYYITPEINLSSIFNKNFIKNNICGKDFNKKTWLA